MGKIHVPTGIGVGHRLSIAVIALCLALFAMCAFLAPDAEAKDLRLLRLNNAAWKSEMVSVAHTDVVIDGGQLYPQFTIPAGSEQIAPIVGDGFGIATVTAPTSGDLRIWTEASFDDGKTTNSVDIPLLPEALTESGVYSFEAIRSGASRSTYLLFVPASGGAATATVKYFDGTNRPAGSESFDVAGLTFQKLSLPLTIGRIELRLQGSKLGAPGLTTGSFYAVAFVGRDAGKPRVEVPTLK